VGAQQILIAMTAGDSPALGNVWRLTAKKNDFYLDPVEDAGTFHLSAHGPNERFEGHRFHVKLDRRLAASASERGRFVEHSLPRRGFAFDGQQLDDGVFFVARIRWTWDLQRNRYRQAAMSGPVPQLTEGRWGARLSTILAPNDAWDIDVVVSYGRPYWPHATNSLRDNARLGPLKNDAGLCLTATSFHRSQMKYPTPAGLSPPLPSSGEVPNRIMGGGPGPEGPAGVYWLVESITKRELLLSSREQ
jgi:hypothetical protein